MPDRAAVIDSQIERIAHDPFRARFHLRPQELDYLASRGLDTVRRHAREIVTNRVAPAHPAKDGRQTPWGGHPVFRAQHATATCCRGCLAKNYGIRPGRDLTDAEIDDVVEVICRWIRRDLDRVTGRSSAQTAPPRAATGTTVAPVGPNVRW